jgi:hypothetical protein
MQNELNELLENPQNTEAVAAAWPVIKAILVEQQLVLVAKDEDDGSKKLKGFAVAYRCLERFAIAGRTSLESRESK